MVSLAISTISGIGLWSVVVVMPLIQAEFAVDRADASLPYTATMLGFAVGAIFMGRLSDRRGIVWPLTIGGVRTLLLGSALQTLTLIFYLPFDGLTSLYIVSALFGLSQGGIVPSYAIIVREYFPAEQAGTRISLIITTSIVGMALGGWMSGAIFDLTGSYRIAFLNGIAWNLVNVAIALWLLWQPKRTPLAA
ncbi:MAG: MFS transporter [Alphaproteobacteria bacterium]